MKIKNPKTSRVTQTNLFAPNNSVKPHPLRQAVHRALRESTRVRIMPFIALSLAGLATPTLALPARFDIVNLIDGGNGFELIPVTAGDETVPSASYAGDINGDGIGDLLIDARGIVSIGRNDNDGASYVVFGASGVGASGSVELTALDGHNGFVINDIAEGDDAE